jgi:hypothetical protein
MFVNVYYNVAFARDPIGTKVKGYHHKNPMLQTFNKLFNDSSKELDIFPFNAFWPIKELLEYLNFINVVPN